MLRLVKYQNENQKTLVRSYEGLRPLEDHRQLLDRYIQAHRMKNHADETVRRQHQFLSNWFAIHGRDSRPLYVWEGMEPVIGRRRIQNYAQALIDSELASATIRRNLGFLRGFFSYVVNYPHLIDDPTGQSIRIQDRYGALENPVNDFDVPTHVYNGEQKGIPLDPERLYDFYQVVREKYLPQIRNPWIGARNYALLVLAGESGLRIDELLHLELQDLFFDSKKIQTRFAKGTRGSGKRARTTVFTPLARDTISYYLKQYRPRFPSHRTSALLFLTRLGTQVEYNDALNPLKTMVRVAQKEGFPILEHMAWHWLRRIFATRFIERFPGQLPALIQMLGHVSPNTVHCYIRHSEAWLDEKIQEVLKGETAWRSIGS
jgi:site-specific recombinase XerD